jgi:hypothetical protein
MGLVRDTEVTELNMLSRIGLRLRLRPRGASAPEGGLWLGEEMPILDKLPAFGQLIARRAETLLFVPAKRGKQKIAFYLCDLCDSVVR